MSDVEEAICGASTQLPPEFEATGRRITGTGWDGVTVTRDEDPNPLT